MAWGVMVLVMREPYSCIISVMCEAEGYDAVPACPVPRAVRLRLRTPLRAWGDGTSPLYTNRTNRLQYSCIDIT